MKVVVTGAAGGLGAEVCKRLLKQDMDVVGVDIADEVPAWAAGLDWWTGWQGDVCDAARMLRMFRTEDPDAIINLAGVLGTEELWTNPAKAINVNLIGAVNLLQCATIHEAHYIGIETGTFWNTPYSVSKRAARELAQGYTERLGTRTTTLRVMNVYGPFHSLPSKVVPRFFRAALQGKPIPVNGTGVQMLDLVWGEDVADAFVAAVQVGVGEGEVIEVGSVPITVLQFAEMVQDVCGVSTGFEHLPARKGEGRLFPAVLEDLRTLGVEPRDHTDEAVFRLRLEKVRDYYIEVLAEEASRVG